MASRGLARETGVPASYQAKVLQMLRREGIVLSHRGTGGGFVLSRPAEELSVWEVIEAIDPDWSANGGLDEGDPFRILHGRLHEGVERLRSALEAISIAEVCPAPGERRIPFPR